MRDAAQSGILKLCILGTPLLPTVSARGQSLKAAPETVKNVIKNVIPGVPWWPSGLRIRYCCCCGLGLILGSGISKCCGRGQKKKRKKNVIPGSRFVRVSGQGRKKTPPGDVSLDWPLLEAAGAEFYGTI